MPEASPVFLVAVAFDGTLVRPRRGDGGWDAVPGATDFLAWLSSNGFGLSLWTVRVEAALDVAVEWLAGSGVAESDWTSMGPDHPPGCPFGAVVTVDSPGFPMLRMTGSRVVPDWERIRSNLLARRAWRDEGAVGAQPAVYLSPDAAPLPKAPRRRRSPAPVVAAKAGAATAERAAPTLPENLGAALVEAALDPHSATVDGQTVQGHSLPDLIAADRYLASKKAAAGGAHRAIQSTQMIHSGPR